MRPGLRRAGCRLTLLVAVAVGSTTVGLVGPSSARADDTSWVAVRARLHVHGRGYGHGRGMSQYGAQGAALHGWSYRRIASFYYPHTRWARARGDIKVLLSGHGNLVVSPARGLTVTELRTGRRWSLPRRDRIRRWRLAPARHGRLAAQYRDRRGWHGWRPRPGARRLRGKAEFSAPGALTRWVDLGGPVVKRRYRGRLRTATTASSARHRAVVNVLPLERYLRGVVPWEMPATWRPAAVRAQAVAARTYAVRWRAAAGRRAWDICDTTSCQVYGGRRAEHPAGTAAVRATRGRILTHRGRPALTEFSSSTGGWTAPGGAPYLVAHRDRPDGWGGNPNHTWRATVSAGRLADSYPGIGRLVAVRVSKRNGYGKWNGRVEQVVLRGRRGRVRVSGGELCAVAGLRSTWFAIRDPAARHGGSSASR